MVFFPLPIEIFLTVKLFSPSLLPTFTDCLHYYGFGWLLTTQDSITRSFWFRYVRPPRLRLKLFHSIYPPHLHWLIGSVTIGLQLLLQSYPQPLPSMWFLFVGPEFCLQLPSDSTSPWTPLFSTRYFPLLGRTRDFNPLEFDHAGQTKNPSFPLDTQRGGQEWDKKRRVPVWYKDTPPV